MKKSASGELIRAIEDALEDRQYLSPALSKEALNESGSSSTNLTTRTRRRTSRRANDRSFTWLPKA